MIQNFKKYQSSFLVNSLGLILNATNSYILNLLKKITFNPKNIIISDVFIQQLTAKIYYDLMDLVSAKVSQVMALPDIVFDIHIHIFDKYYITKNYIHLRLLSNFLK
jgi:hypothetical protein